MAAAPAPLSFSLLVFGGPRSTSGTLCGLPPQAARRLEWHECWRGALPAPPEMRDAEFWYEVVCQTNGRAAIAQLGERQLKI